MRFNSNGYNFGTNLLYTLLIDLATEILVISFFGDLNAMINLRSLYVCECAYMHADACAYPKMIAFLLELRCFPRNPICMTIEIGVKYKKIVFQLGKDFPGYS